MNSPESVLLLLPQVEVPLNHSPNMLRLIISELGQVQLLCCCASRHVCEYETCELAGWGWEGGGFLQIRASKATVNINQVKGHIYLS